MSPKEKTIDHSTLQRLVRAGAHVAAEVVAGTGGWGVVIKSGSDRQTLAATRGKPRTFRKFETLAGYLKDLGIVEYHVNSAEFEPATRSANPQDKRSTSASARMKQTQEAAAYDTWFRGQVQASMDDARPNISDEEARKEFAAMRSTIADSANKPTH